MFFEEALDFDDLPFLPNEECQFLDAAIRETQSVKEELQACLDSLEKLSMKADEKPAAGFLQQISPGVSWKEAEYLSYTIDSMINEERQKHDSQQPQQHHKVQEINDDSTCSVWSLSSSIINHSRRFSSNLHIDAGGAGDFETLSNSTTDDFASTKLDFLQRHKILAFKLIKIKMPLQSALTQIQCGKTISRARATKMKDYSYKQPKQKKGLAKLRTISRRRSV